MLGEAAATLGAQIAAHADFYGNLALGQHRHQFGIFSGSQGMANALRANVDGCPYGFRPDGLAGMGGDAQAILASKLKHFAKYLRRPTALVAADAEAHHRITLLATTDGFFSHTQRRLGAEMPDGVEYP